MYRGYRTGEDDGARLRPMATPAAVRAMMEGLWEDRGDIVGESEA